jgi:hypothetical protein
MQPLFVAKRPFDCLCPTVPEQLTAADWDHNLHADYLAFFFRSHDYLRNRVMGLGRLNILAVLQNPTHSDVAAMRLPDFTFAGFDLVDVHGDISALTNCGGFEGVFRNTELSELGLLTDLSRAQEVRASLRVQYPEESHAQCHVWAIWRQSRA